MNVPRGINIEGMQRDECVLQLEKNLYGQKQAGCAWHEHLCKNLKLLGFIQSKRDECVFYFNKSIFIIYTDDTILMGPGEKELENIIKLLQSKFKVQSEGDLCDYLGILIKKEKDHSMNLTQPQLIKSIIEDLKLNTKDAKGKATA